MTVYQAVRAGDVWAMSTVDGDKPALVASTTSIGPDDLDGVFSWMADHVGRPLFDLLSVGAHVGGEEVMFVGTDEAEFVAVIAEQLR